MVTISYQLSAKAGRFLLRADGWRLRAFLKNEATDLIENKGSRPRKVRNEATVCGAHSSRGATK